jgi:hypothetical protein
VTSHRADPRPRINLRRVRRHIVVATATLVIAGVVGLTAFVGYWFSTGGRAYTVETPSMGTTAPVGTLLWVRPIDGQGLHVGEFISFHPPTEPQATFSHRIVAIDPDGAIATKGDLNGAIDPWQLRSSDVIGTVTMRWWDVGWLLKAAPVLVIGGFVLWLLLTYFTVARWRLPAAIAGSSLLVAFALHVVRPLVRAQLLSFTALADHSGARAEFVSTGILPLRISGTGTTPMSIRAGQLRSVLVTQHDSKGIYSVHLGVHLSPWLWLAIVVTGLAPAIWISAVGLPAGHRRRTAVPA